MNEHAHVHLYLVPGTHAHVERKKRKKERNNNVLVLYVQAVVSPCVQAGMCSNSVLTATNVRPKSKPCGCGLKATMTIPVDTKERNPLWQENTMNSQIEDSWCPLFSEDLPPDFASNTKLAAIASLLNGDNSDDNDDGNNYHDDDDDNESGNRNGMMQYVKDELHPPGKSIRTKSKNFNRVNSATTTTTTGGGKTKRNKRRKRKSGAPYPNRTKFSETQTKTKDSSVGEAQLFLHLWKI